MYPRWITWIFIIALGYMVFSASRTGRDLEQGRTVRAPVITAEKYPALAELTDTEQWKRKLNPDYAAVMNCSLDKPKTSKSMGLKVIEDAVGEGEDVADCGETITVAMTLWDDKGSKLYSTETELALGSRQVASGLDAGLRGMKVGGERTLVLPPHTLVSAKESEPHAALRKVLSGDKLAIVTVKRLK